MLNITCDSVLWKTSSVISIHHKPRHQYWTLAIIAIFFYHNYQPQNIYFNGFTSGEFAAILIILVYTADDELVPFNYHWTLYISSVAKCYTSTMQAAPNIITARRIFTHTKRRLLNVYIGVFRCVYASLCGACGWFCGVDDWLMGAEVEESEFNRLCVKTYKWI